MKKTVLLSIVMVLALSMAITGSIAYLSDTDSDVNVMTLGNVDIEQLEYQRVVENGAWVSTGETDTYSYTPDKLEGFKQAKPLYPAYFADGDIKWDDRIDSHQQSWKQIDAPGSNQLFDDSVKGAMDKFVFVKNTGASDAYVRTWFAFEQGSVAGDKFENIIKTNGDADHWAWKTVANDVEIGDNKYVVAYATYTGPKSNPTGILAAGDTSYPSLLQVYMMPTATNDDVKAIDGNGDGLYNILVFSQAVQTINFPNAETALNAAFGTDHPWHDEDTPSIPVLVDTADQAYEAFSSFDKSGKSGTVILNADYNTADAQNHWSSNREYALRAAGTDVTFNLNGHKVNHNTSYQDEKNTGYTYLFTTAYNGKLTVNGEGGSIYSENTDGHVSIFYAQGPSEIVINGGEYHAVSGVPVWAGNGAKVTINGGKFTSSKSGNDEEMIYSSGGIIDIYDGFFHSDWESRPVNVANANRGTGFINIYGGTFVNFDPSTGGDDPNNIKVMDGYKVVSETQENGDVWYTVIPE
ncbi:MAG: hypothetical protein IJD39_08490 [Clostridia bacterium]|nr:hypothetical protein [Clostridia bacterium]